MTTTTTNAEQATLLISEVCAVLKAAPGLPITVIWPDGEPIEAHFHVTEVGRVQKDFVDCGGTVRRVTTCLLQTWVGDDVDHHITGAKLLKAFEFAAPVLKGEDLPMELEYEACNVVTLRVVAVENTGAALIVRLAGKHTDCLAKDLCIPNPKSDGTCTPGSGCC
ncbi:DUF6428 family protein [Rariglobus hedericola]|uniref:Uncharacterized protein n=2 Tax=Rariglobus hedericola TaxID=2597822 RepID=A0A556QJM6_9BACT|nr:DUF6428 family protein [Rariglobus hedericola]TSJ76854.1 hypothetical protein FPL22_12095 [Rariglobus hedericola]